jgi:hypothetical protein
MSHFAKIENGIVTDVIVAEKDFIDSGAVGDPNSWVQTSYNTRGGIHYGEDGLPDGGVALRGNYAGIGSIYNKTVDVFYIPQPFPSWNLNTTTWTWEAPLPEPTEGIYSWDEPSLSWKMHENQKSWFESQTESTEE